jgi:hypothetical protein
MFRVIYRAFDTFGWKSAVWILLVLHAGLLSWGDWLHSPTIDEVGHLPAGLSHWQSANFDLYRVNPPLVRMVASLPIFVTGAGAESRSLHHPYPGRAEFKAGREFVKVNGPRSFWLFTVARWACIPFSLLGGFICFRWSQELYGSLAGLIAVTLWCFCPNILGNAQMITPDIGATSLGVFAAYLFRGWLHSTTWFRAFLAGFVLGLAELTKTTWIILFGVWPCLWLMVRFNRLQRRSLAREVGQLLLIVFLAVYVINLGYAFEQSFEPLGDYRFVSKSLAGATPPDNRFADSALGLLPIPLPRNYVLGIDQQKRDFEIQMLSYLRGEWRMGGWWYYYLYGLGIKVPLGTWMLILLAAIMPFLKFAPRVAWRDELVLLLPVVAILTLVSSQTGFNHHLRYVLPLFPFVFIWVSKVAILLSWSHWKVTALGLSALAWSIISSLSVYPHSLSYFNELVGGPKGGPNHFVNSSIDWGQDLPFLKKWLDQHPEARPLGLVFFGYFDPRVAAIEFSLPPGIPVSDETSDKPALDLSGPRPGWYAISVTMLKGYKFPIADGKGGIVSVDKPYFTYFQRFEPVAMAGYSIYIYHVTLDDANRVRKELGLPELTSEEAREKP